MNIDSRSKYPCVALMLACLPATAEYESRKDHKEYDFHDDIRYPGRLRSDVGRDKVTQQKAKDLKGYPCVGYALTGALQTASQTCLIYAPFGAGRIPFLWRNAMPRLQYAQSSEMISGATPFRKSRGNGEVQ